MKADAMKRIKKGASGDLGIVFIRIYYKEISVVRVYCCGVLLTSFSSTRLLY